MKATTVFLLLNAIKPIISAVSRVHTEIDRIYDSKADEQPEIEGINTAVAPTTIIAPVNIPPSNFLKLDDIVLIQVISFIEEPIAFSLSCKWFWKVYSALSSHRVFNSRLIVPEHFNLLAHGDSSTSVPVLTRAFGNRDQRISPEFLANNLELALYSPAIRAAFDIHLWQHVRKTSVFQELTKSVFMKPESGHIESHRRTLLYILASLPKIPEIIENFFIEFPLNLLNPSTENCFQKLYVSISERIALLSRADTILSLFSFDERIIINLVRIYFQTANHSALKHLFETDLPEEFKTVGKSYIGCVSMADFGVYAGKYLNILDPEMIEMVSLIELIRPAHFDPFLAALLERSSPVPLDISIIFHVAVLKQFWAVLNEIQDFNFSYDKNDSEFLTSLIESDPNYIDYLLLKCPKLASHRAFLLNPKYQHRHFSTLTSLRDARVNLKLTIDCPEITRSHIIYIQDYQIRLFNLLLADSAERILNYFTMNLKGHERKRYKEHASFNIALTTLDVHYETRLQRKLEIPELDPEMILRQMFIELNLLRHNPQEYLELAHCLPTFAKALLAGGYEEEDTLSIPEAALTKNFDEIEMLSRTIALSRVIHDGTSTNYRLVLNWLEQFGSNLAGRIIPVHELKALLKGAAFRTIRTPEDKKLRFNLDNQSRDELFSMTYRYAIIILVTQCKGIQASVIKRLKNLFPAADNSHESEDFTNLVRAGCSFYRQHSAFFSNFNFIATNSRSERFLIDFLRHFIKIKNFQNSDIGQIISEFFTFINLDPYQETLLKDHFIYFILLASFKFQ